jgi:hypothetical protein
MASTGVDRPNNMSSYLVAVAAECEALASVVLIDGLSPRAVESDTKVRWRQDLRLLETHLGTEEPARIADTAAAIYLAEAAHELAALAALLRLGVLTASTGPLTRAIVERLGVVDWMLDVQGPDALERGWRAVLNQLFCFKEYRKAIEQMGARRVSRTNSGVPMSRCVPRLSPGSG